MPRRDRGTWTEEFITNWNLRIPQEEILSRLSLDLSLSMFWNEFLDRTGGITMQLLEAGKKDKGEWVASRYSDFSFHTGVAYVSKVRFDNGEIWSADTNAVLAEMRKIQKDFDAAELKKKPGEKP